ncbi:MAG: hypothetical protein A2020_06655 [Lentisphaerae bacterium GWF2_45_14]|nr:MAG: hypothetical protein A2020_06655 [Lentisphaerae bacterium GWF2_45_14]
MKREFFGDKFLYGASCAPYAKSMDWPMEEWDRDLAMMKEMHFNIARIFVPWDRIEQKEGVLDFSKQDHFMEVAERHGIGVLLNVGGVFDNLQGIYPPQWLVRKYPTVPQQEDSRIPEQHSGPRIRICMDDLIYREKAFDFIAKSVRRYAEHPATVGWMIWNEPWLKNCCCPATMMRFKAWIKEKYRENLDELNRLWGSEFPLEYEKWEDVEAPNGVGFLGGGLNAWRDWIEFNDFRLSEAMMTVTKIVKENDPCKHPCTANMVHPFSQLSNAYKSLDIAGYSYYTVAHGEGLSLTPFLKALICDTYRWFSKDEKRRTLVLETEAGPNNFMITGEQRRLNNYLAIGHNAKSIVCWNYRSRYSDSQVCNFNLMGWDGSITPRAKQHAEMAKTFTSHAELINDSYLEAEAGVLIPDNLAILAMSTHCGVPGHGGSYEDFAKSRFGAFKLLWDMNIASDGIAECHLKNIDRYKIILLPLIENMSPEIAKALKEYVSKGGTLIAESPFAFKDENNFLLGTAPIYGLDEVFGAKTRDREGKETASSIVYTDGRKGKVCFLWHPYEVTTGKAVANYEDGRAAVVVNSFGKGKAIVTGTEFFRQYYNDADSANTEFLRNAILDSGVKRNAEILIDGEIAESSGIEACRLSGKKGIIYIILNHNEKEVNFQLRLREHDNSWKDMETDKEINIEKEQMLPANGVLAIFK